MAATEILFSATTFVGVVGFISLFVPSLPAANIKRVFGARILVIHLSFFGYS